MRTLLFLVVFCIVGIVTTYLFLKPEQKKPDLPVLNPIDLDTSMVEDAIERVGFGHKIAKFKLIDQFGNPFSSHKLAGKVYVAEFFFTTCGTICPRMNQQLMRVQQAYRGNQKVALVSFTVDPIHDTPKQLNAYAASHHANPGQWHFLTGEKEEIYRIARRSYFLLKPAEVENQGDVGSDFIHTNNFVLIDQKGRIRAYYDGTSADEVNHLIADIKQLCEEI